MKVKIATLTKKETPSIRWIVWSTAALLALSICLMQTSQAESLFRGGISYQTSQGYVPKSLFSSSRPQTVGDVVTVQIDDTTVINNMTNTRIQKERTINENSTNILNNMVKKVFGVNSLLPTINGLDNNDNANMVGQMMKTFQYRENVGCQVVQVLPNGFLVIQGKKTIFANQEQQDILVSGIINPFFLDSRNMINARQVGNFQMNIGGHGIISRQQSDGILGKYFQFVN